MLIYKALLKYGYSQFSLEILEFCVESVIIEREQHYINLLKPEYNTLKIAGSTWGYLHSDEARAKIAAAYKGEGNPMYGKKRIHSEETRSKISISKKGKPKVLGASALLAKRILVLDLETNISTEYDSRKSASKALNIPVSRFTMYFSRNQNKPFKGRYVFKEIT
jgi:group I intron endonuclease